MPKAPRFFCDSCDAEVPASAKSCPGCGRYFASVKCPACDFVGEQDLFKGGCPVCGYSSGASSQGNVRREKAGRGRGGKKPADPLPLWVYILTAAVFTGILAALFFLLF